MKRVCCIALALAMVCGLSASAAFAGPGCCKSKMDTKNTTMSAMTSCSMGEFPHMTFLVGDKTMDCPSAAEKAAEANGGKVRFAVANETFDCKDKALAALADQSERYVKRYMAIAAIVDGKLVYCKDDLTGCGEAKTASADGSSCSKAKTIALTSAEEGKSCSSKKAELAKAEGSGCSKSKATLASAEEGKSCSAKKAELAKAEGSGCSKSKATLASAEEGKSCSAKKAELAKAEGSGCSKSKAGAEVASFAKSCSTGDIACVSKEEFGKLVKSSDTKFMVLNRSFDSYDDAAKARDTAMGSVKLVKMKYMVDGKEVGCSTQVCPSAKKAGKVSYVVGEDKTGCEVTARIALAKAQYDAAKKAADEKLAKM